MDNAYAALPAEISQIIRHTSLESSFILKCAFKPSPGQFVMVSLPGAGEAPISISGLRPGHIELTIRNVGKVTSEIFNRQAGDYLYIRGPYGNGFPLDTFQNQQLLMIVGGSAIAPIKPVIEAFLHDHFNLKCLNLLAGFKSPKHILFRKELESWKKKCHVTLTVDNDEDYAWMGSIGFVVQFIKDVPDIGKETKVVLIGPPMMMKNSIRELLGHNVEEGNIWVSFERHMQCGVGLCGHCRINDKYVCIDGPVFNYQEVKELID